MILDPVTRKLVVNEPEASTRSAVYSRSFLRKRTLVATLREIDRLGIKLKEWTTRKEPASRWRPV